MLKLKFLSEKETNHKTSMFCCKCQDHNSIHQLMPVAPRPFGVTCSNSSMFDLPERPRGTDSKVANWQVHGLRLPPKPALLAIQSSDVIQVILGPRGGN